MTLKTISCGGGVQSTALVVLAAQGRIDYDLAVMANVGDDSEHPATLRYVRNVLIPYATAAGIDFHLLDRHRRDGSVETLWSRLMDPRPCPVCKNDIDDDCERCGGAGIAESRSLPIPVRMSNGAPGRRSCTADFKIKVISRFLRGRGATATNPATVAIGISLDEIERANNRRSEPYEQVVYPLIGVGDDTGLKLNRLDCMRIIADAGLPIPPKSSCFFCPFHATSAWQDMARDEPDLFDRSVALEDALNARRQTLGKDPIYLTRFGMPLRQVFAGTQDQLLLPLADDSTPGQGLAASCDGGWCHT